MMDIESNAFTRAVLDSAPVGIWVMDQEGRTTQVNRAAETAIGLPAAELMGRSHHEVVLRSGQDGFPYDEAACPVQASLRGGEVRRVTSGVFWRPDGTSFPVEYSTAPIRRDDGIVGIVMIFTDATEKRRFETQLLHAQKLESIGSLAAGIAHEINTPTQYATDNMQFLTEAFESIGHVLRACTGVVTAEQAVEDSAEPVAALRAALDGADAEYLIAEIPAAIEQSLDGLQQISRIVLAMKEFSHPGTGHKALTDLNRAIRNTVTVCRNEWRYVADLELDLDGRLPLVPCLSEEFQQAVLNIVVNAAHAIEGAGDDAPRQKGKIIVSSSWEGDWAEVRIRDTGSGIPSHILDRIFDPLFTTKEVGRGTGQGLAITRSVVIDKHGGTIDVDTEVGRGSTFIVRLPIDEAAVPVLEAVEAGIAGVETGPKVNVSG